MSDTRLNSPPSIPGNFLLGNLLQMKEEGVHFYTRVSREYGDAVLGRIGGKRFNIFFHPDHLKEVLCDKEDTYVKGAQYNQLRHLLGTGLLTSQAGTWEKQRRMLNPLFGKNGLDALLIHINRGAESFVGELHPDVELDWSRKMFDYTLRVAMASFFGANFTPEKLDGMARDTHECMRFVSRRMTNFINPPLWLPTKKNLSFKASLNNIRNEVSRIYAQKIKHNGNAPSSDMLDLLISAQDEDKFRLTKDEVFDQIMSFLIAGHETTAISMSWLFYLLAKKPHYQDQLIAEAERNDYRFNSSLDLSNYPFLSAVINETMRLYPAGWVIARNCIEDDSVGGFKVKKNRVVAVCPWVIHRDPRWWHDPEAFTPERFLDEDMLKKLPKGAFVPFSIGRRNCIGARFSLMEIMVFCLHFFRHYRLSSTQGPVGVKGFVTLKTDRPIKVFLQKRN